MTKSGHRTSWTSVAVAAALAMGATLAASAADAKVQFFTLSGPSVNATWNQGVPPALSAPTVHIASVKVNDFVSDLGAGFNVASIGYADGVNTTGLKAHGFNFTGAVLFSGSRFSPVFTAGTYSLSSGETLTISGPVPEPATWAMMLVGVGGLGAILRANRKRGLALAAV